MAWLIDTNLWIDLSRSKSPRALKTYIAPFIEDARACIAEPIIFEVLRCATDAEARLLTAQFETMPLLASPDELWAQGIALGRACQRTGLTANSIDLLIAAIAIYHSAEVVTFDGDYERIATVSKLRVKLLKRPGS